MLLRNDELNIQIDETSGDIRTSRDIDREILCKRLDQVCKFSAEIISKPMEFFQLFKVELIISDLNDNSPIFPKSTIDLNLAENAKIGTFLRLDSATDADTPQFGIKSYTLNDPTGYFELVQEDIDGRIIPQLKLGKELDYEKRGEHHLTLTATDGGSPPRYGTADIIVHVVDINDHSPVFQTGSRVECNIPENLEIGDVVAVLNATDADDGPNGRITYSYQETLVPEELRNMFLLNSNSGVITIGEKLDFEKEKTHILYVRASDNGGGNSVPTYATVIVNILDVNDNRPEIKVSFMDDTQGDADGVHYISEDIAVGEFVAFVSVTDNDANEKGKELKTELDQNEDFELVTVDLKNNRYLLKTKKTLDRERIESYQLSIKSIDNGSSKK